MDVWIVSEEIEFEVLLEPMQRSRKIGCAADVEKEGGFGCGSKDWKGRPKRASVRMGSIDGIGMGCFKRGSVRIGITDWIENGYM